MGGFNLLRNLTRRFPDDYKIADNGVYTQRGGGKVGAPEHAVYVAYTRW